MSSDSNGSPSSSSSSRPLPSRPHPSSASTSHLMTRSALASFTSPSLTSTLSEPTPQSSSHKRTRFNVERIYEFEAPQFYDFTKQSDPERGHLDEHWFDSRRRTPSSPDFHFTSSTTFRPKSASGKIYHKGNFSGSNGGLSFMNTPIGRGQTFTIPSSVGGTDIRSSISFKPRAALKKSATTENVANSILMNSDSSDPPSTIIRSVQKSFKEFGSDERKIISGFLSTPLLVIKTPSASGDHLHHHHNNLPRSPLQKVTTKKSNLSLFPSSLLVRETSSIELKSNEPDFIEETETTVRTTLTSLTSTSLTSSASLTDCSVPNSSILSNQMQSNPHFINHNWNSSVASIKEHERFQASVKARILEEREKIELNAAAQAKKLQKLKSGPTNLPVKSIKPLTVPKGFAFKSDERERATRTQLKKSNVTNLAVKKLPPSTLAQKFVPTIPKSPLFASKLRATAKQIKVSDGSTCTSDINNENFNNNPASAIDLRRKLEYKGPNPNSKTTTIPQSPKLSSIHRNRTRNISKSDNSNK